MQQLQQYRQQSLAPGSTRGAELTDGPGTQEGQGRQLGAAILEPVLQGAGGMRLVDPLFQRALVEACRCVLLLSCSLFGLLSTRFLLTF
jgi:adenosylmethionine-8-amino-7-oxononanoate aminotransferase